MDRGEELLEAVLRDPSRATCAVYGDHLVEQGDPRGELISLEVRRAERLDPAERRALRRRRDQLLDAYAATWWPWERLLRPRGDAGLAVGTRFGFLSRAWLFDEQLFELGPTLFAREPVVDLYLDEVTPAAVDHVLAAPWLPRIRHFGFGRAAVPARLLASPRLRQLRSVACEPAAEAIPALVDGLPALTDVDTYAHGDAVVDALLARPRRLVRFVCRGGLSTDGWARFLAGSWPGLQHLEIQNAPLGDAGLFALAAAADRLPELRKLQLVHVDASEAAMRALGGAPWAQKHLQLRLFDGPGHRRFGRLVVY